MSPVSNKAEVPPEPDDHAPLDTRLLWAGLFVCLALFAKVPRVDLAVAMYYWSPQQGFVHAHDPLVTALYLYSPWVGRAIVATLAVFALLSPALARWLRGRGRAELAARCAGPWRRVAVVAVLSGLLGPGLLIEGLLKNEMGRPRPVQVIELGGQVPFQGPFEPGPHTDNHRSFVSSHAAAGFWLLSLGLTCGPVWRRRWLLIGLVAGSVIGAARMMQGGHFLSDIIFAFYTVWLSGELVAALERKWQGRHLPPPSRPHRPPMPPPTAR